MAYTTTTTSETNIVWDSNPSGNQATAKVNGDGSVAEFTILDGNQILVLNTVDAAMLEFIRQSIVDLQTVIGAL